MSNPGGTEQKETAQEKRLQRDTDEALGYLFESPDEFEEFDFGDFRHAIEQNGSRVTLTLSNGQTREMPGDIFVNWVWELIANA